MTRRTDTLATTAQPQSRNRGLAMCALCIALLVASCFFTIPLGPVPFTLQTAVVILIALLLTPRQAAATTGVYLIMGAIGLPVFSSMTGGLGKLLGPTGGFLVSYLLGTFIASNVRIALERRGVKQVVCDVACAASVIVCSDVLGWLWIMVAANLDPLSAFLTADAPFIFVDCCKAVVSILVATAVRKGLALDRQRNQRG